MNNRYDSLDKYYKTIELFEKISKILYLILFILSLVILYVNDKNVNNILSGLFIIITLYFFISNNYLKIYLIPRIENKRRVHLLSNSLGVHLDYENSNGYYNNSIQPSLLKLGANVFENSLFSKAVVSKMLLKERMKIALYTCLFFGSIIYKGIDLSAVTIVAQTLFSGEIISKWIYMEFLQSENERIFDNMHRVFLSYTDNKKIEFNAQIIDNFVRYESAKAYCGIKQSTRIFFEINGETSNEWKEIKKTLKIDEYRHE